MIKTPNNSHHQSDCPIKLIKRAPIYFNSTELIEEVYGREVRRVLMDAGLVVMMSPALLGLAEAMRIYPGRRYVVVSLGGGIFHESREIKSKGVHANSLSKILRAGIEGALAGGPQVAEQVLSLLPNVIFFRINFDVDNKNFDDASDKNMMHIKDAAFHTIVGDKLKRVLGRLQNSIKNN